MSVVLFHAEVWPLRSGFLGVDVFFVISGYLLGGIIHRQASEGRFSLLEFYARRARRILPALIVVTLAILAAGWLLLSPSEVPRTGVSAAYSSLALSNFRFWRMPFIAPNRKT